MIDDTTAQERAVRPLGSSFERYLQDKGKGRGGGGGNYRRTPLANLNGLSHGPLASAATRTGPGSFPRTLMATRSSGTSTSGSSGSTPGTSPAVGFFEVLSFFVGPASLLFSAFHVVTRCITNNSGVDR
jgi:hypothetical protein